MSRSLDLGTTPEGTIAKTDWDGKYVDVGPLRITMEDFCELAMYVLTNTDLQSGDARFRFISQLAKLNVIDGYSPGRKRLG